MNNGDTSRNLDLVDQVRGLAEQRGVDAAQVALAWVLHRGDDDGMSR